MKDIYLEDLVEIVKDGESTVVKVVGFPDSPERGKFGIMFQVPEMDKPVEASW
jgi:hypothetical protein